MNIYYVTIAILLLITLLNAEKYNKYMIVFKSGDRSSVKCYRPISLLSNTSKVLERLIYNEVSYIQNY